MRNLKLYIAVSAQLFFMSGPSHSQLLPVHLEVFLHSFFHGFLPEVVDVHVI